MNHHRRGRQNHPRLPGGRSSAGGIHAPFKHAFFADLERLRIKRADTYPAATDPRHIDAMIEMIETLIERGLAYQADDKSVYFRIKNFPEYGKLAHFDLDELQPTGRVKNDEYDKENVGDFALWKAWDEADGEVRWESPWGRAGPAGTSSAARWRPRFWATNSIFTAAAWTTFSRITKPRSRRPKAAPGRQFVRYWLHCAHLLVDGQKMSKSLGNFYTLRDVLAKGYTGREVRYALTAGALPRAAELHLGRNGGGAGVVGTDR